MGIQYISEDKKGKLLLKEKDDLILSSDGGNFSWPIQFKH